MILGTVVGEVWATRKHPALCGHKLLIVEPRFVYDPPHDIGHLVALDPIGANVGQEVIVCMGDPGRRIVAATVEETAAPSPLVPVDATVLGIVDRVDLP